MAVINYDDYTADGSNYQDYWTIPYNPATTTDWFTYYMHCPHCNGWILNNQWYRFCPHCGKEFYPQVDKKAEIIKRLDTILKEVEDIKKELAK